MGSSFSRPRSSVKTHPSWESTLSVWLPRSGRSGLHARRWFSIGQWAPSADPHQSPFWIKAMGAAPSGGATRPLALVSPRKSSVPCSCPSGGAGVLPFLGPAGVDGQVFRPSTPAGNPLADPFTDAVASRTRTAVYGGRQPLNGSRQRRIRLKPVRSSTVWDGTAAQSVLVVVPTPLQSSPSQPVLGGSVLTQRPSPRRRALGRAGCNSTPAPVCGRPS